MTERKSKQRAAYYAPENTEGDFLTRRQAATLLRCSLAVLDHIPIKKIKHGRRIILRKNDILTWADQNAKVEVYYDN